MARKRKPEDFKAHRTGTPTRNRRANPSRSVPRMEGGAGGDWPDRSAAGRRVLQRSRAESGALTCPKCGGGGTRPHDGFGMLAHVRPAFPNAPPETPQQEDRMSHTDQPHPSLCPACGGLPIDPPLEGAACSTCGRAGSAWAPSADLLGAQPINAAELVAELVAAAPQLQDAIDARAAEVANPAPTVAEELARLAKEIAMSEAAAGCMIILIHPSGGMEFGTVAQAGPAAKLLSDIHRGTIAITQGAPVPGGDPQCHACQGSKRIAGRICLACGGKGTIPKATAPVVHRG